MFDIGWQELFIVAAIAIIVVGPRDLPRALKSITIYIGKAKAMVRELQGGIEEVAREVDLENIREEAERTANLDFKNSIDEAVQPVKDLEQEFGIENETGVFMESFPETITEEEPDPKSQQKIVESTSDKKTETTTKSVG